MWPCCRQRSLPIDESLAKCLPALALLLRLCNVCAAAKRTRILFTLAWVNSPSGELRGRCQSDETRAGETRSHMAPKVAAASAEGGGGERTGVKRGRCDPWVGRPRRRGRGITCAHLGDDAFDAVELEPAGGPESQMGEIVNALQVREVESRR